MSSFVSKHLYPRLVIGKNLHGYPPRQSYLPVIAFFQFIIGAVGETKPHKTSRVLNVMFVYQLQCAIPFGTHAPPVESNNVNLSHRKWIFQM